VAAAENKSAFEIESRRVEGDEQAFACGPMNLSTVEDYISTAQGFP